MTLPQRIVIIGGSAAGMGAAGGAQQVDPDASITVFTELNDVAYSPCGIPYVHGREIDSFDRLVLQDKDFYRERGIDVHYETTVEAIDLARGEVTVRNMGRVPYDSLVVGTGFAYEKPRIAGIDLDGIYYVRSLQLAREWDELLDDVKVAVVVEAQPIGVEMATALARRGIETHLVDPHPWPMAEIADPDIMEPVEESWRELGVNTHFNTLTEALVGNGKVKAVKTSDGELPADMVVIGTKKLPNAQLAEHAGVKTGFYRRYHRWTRTWRPLLAASGRPVTAWRCPRGPPVSRFRAFPAATPTRRARSPAPTPPGVTALTSQYTCRGA